MRLPRRGRARWPRAGRLQRSWRWVGEHVKTLQSDRERLQKALQLGEDLERAQRRVLGVTAPDEATVLEQAVSWQDVRRPGGGDPRLVGATAGAADHLLVRLVWAVPQRHR